MNRNLPKYLSHAAILLLPALMVGGLLAFAGDKADGLKLGLLSLPGCLLIYRSLSSPGRATSVSAWLWWLLFALHSLILSASWLLYSSSMDSYFVIQSLANTTAHESIEYLQHNLAYAAISLVFCVLLSGIYYALLHRFFRHGSVMPTRQKVTWILPVLVVLLSMTAWAIRPIRALSPPVYWYQYSQKIHTFKSQFLKHKNWQQHWLQQAKSQIQPVTQADDSQTIVLMLSESLTGYNLNVCGYPRQTTPHINQRLSELTVFCRAYSAYPTTLDAVKSMLTDVPLGHLGAVPNRSILAEAKAAGFKVFWLSNQDDAYLSSLFGSLADEQVYHNKRSGRSSMAKDEELLPYFQDALKDKAHKKLIILHLIGSHPNYSARYTEPFNLFPGQDEQAISQQLQAAGAGQWTRELRDEYDNSVAYQDWVFSQVFDLLKQDQAAQRGLIFLPDHGNEVGHVKDFAGHSPATEAGYRIPVIMWHNRLPFLKGVNQNSPIDATQLDDNLLFMMGWAHQGETDFIPWTDKAYRFQPPTGYPYWIKH